MSRTTREGLAVQKSQANRNYLEGVATKYVGLAVQKSQANRNELAGCPIEGQPASSALRAAWQKRWTSEDRSAAAKPRRRSGSLRDPPAGPALILV